MCKGATVEDILVLLGTRSAGWEIQENDTSAVVIYCANGRFTVSDISRHFGQDEKLMSDSTSLRLSE